MKSEVYQAEAVVRARVDGDRVTLSLPRFRIVHVVSSLEIGGAEQFVLRTAQMQAQYGHHVSILSIRGGPLLSIARESGLRVKVLKGKSKAMRALQALLAFRVEDPEITHAHNVSALRFAVLAKKVAQTRVVMTDHGQGLGLVREPSQAEWALTDAVIPVGEDVLLRRKIDAISKKSHVIVNGVEEMPARRSRDVVRKELEIPSDRPVCIIASRVDGRKGHHTLIQSAALLRDRQQPVTLVMAGDGPDLQRCRELATELDLSSDWVKFLGFRFDVPDLLAAADFYAQPSITEGIPLSFLEAMWHSLPVIATPVGGTPEVVLDGDTGIFVEVGDAVNVADAMERVIQNDGLRKSLGEAGKQRVARLFRFEDMVLKYHRLYARLRSSGSPGSCPV